jgi:hypothetical protein
LLPGSFDDKRPFGAVRRWLCHAIWQYNLFREYMKVGGDVSRRKAMT